MKGATAQRESSESSRVEELKALLELSQSLHKSLSPDELLPYIVSKAKDLTDAETVAVLLHDQATDELYFRFTEGNPHEDASRLEEIRFPAHYGIAGSILRSGKAELIPDVAQDPRHYKAVDDTTQFETQSMIVVPLEARGKTIGVLEACNKINGEFDEDDLQALIAVADTTAKALDNARRYSELQRSYQELQLIDSVKDNLIESAREENAYLRREIEGRYRFDQITGNSPKMQDLFRICEKVIDSDVTVLIEGETGTGKELVARCIHYNGPRKERRFVTQNCGGMPESLLASELFGHKRGAFTGAISDKRGLFEVAHGGTLFLDEVADMSPAMQVSLLRAVQEGEVRPLGSDQVKKVDVRIISATHHSLEEDVKNGSFRQDLYYRLGVFTIKLPPLREREDDIPLLVEHFLRKYNQKMNKSVNGISRKALACLSSYPFPGNVRELENEIERAVVLAENGKSIEAFHLSDKVISRSSSTDDDFVQEGKLKNMVQEMEKRVLIHMLEQFEGNKTKVARELGMSRFGLMKKMKRYGL
jgi:transcriptional regulator with GAF, ATPase, and Fis domain